MESLDPGLACLSRDELYQQVWTEPVGETDHVTAVVLGDVEVRVRLEERYRLLEEPPATTAHRNALQPVWELWPRHRREATGELALRITDPDVPDVRKTWGDGKRQRVENCLNAFVVGLVRIDPLEHLEDLGGDPALP